MMIYQDWQSLCASDPAKANAICAERMGWEWTWDLDVSRRVWLGADMIGVPEPADWSPITSRDHAAMMVEKVHGTTGWRKFETMLSADVFNGARALLAPPSIISYYACVALDKEPA
jgi:hypothetical protein